jgi:molybdate transport system substrate-binding protein
MRHPLSAGISLVGLALAAFALAAGTPVPAAEKPQELHVAAAANLEGALEALGAAFAARSAGAKVVPTYGASGALFAQIQNGAPFDLFLSADAALPDRLVRAGQAKGSFVYALGKLVVWTPNPPAADVARLGLAALTAPEVRHVALANPATAPYGAAAEAALRKSGLYEALKPKLVLGENVQQAAQFAQSGNAQAAFLPASLATAPPLSEQGRAVPVAPELHDPIQQGGVVLRRAAAPALAEAFAAFLRSSEARAILEERGYGLPAGP